MQTRRLIGRLLGTESKAYLGRLAATIADPARQKVPLSQACGRYVDWYGCAGNAGERPRGVQPPQPQPVAPDCGTGPQCPASGRCLVIIIVCLLASMVIAVVKLS